MGNSGGHHLFHTFCRKSQAHVQKTYNDRLRGQKNFIEQMEKRE